MDLEDLRKLGKVELNSVYNCDCMEGLKYIDDGTIDCIICDLPYGMTMNHWDSIIPLDKLWVEYKRVLKPNGIVILFGSQPFTSMLVMSNLEWFKYSLVWEKNKFSDFMNAKIKPLKIHEDICVFYIKTKGETHTYNPQFSYSTPYISWNKQEALDKQTNYAKLNSAHTESDGRRYPTSVLKFDRHERPEHPTQKPVPLIEYLIKTYSNEGEVILDNCIGSGTTALAAINTNRKYIGFELDKNYYDICMKRIAYGENLLY